MVPLGMLQHSPRVHVHDPSRRALPQKLIDEYNAGSLNAETFFQQLVEFTKALNEEERRGLAENLDEAQLAIYDLLMRPAPELTDAEKLQVKKVAESLLELLKGEKLVLDWRKEQQTRAAVQVAVHEVLDELPDKYTADLYEQECESCTCTSSTATGTTGGACTGAA